MTKIVVRRKSPFTLIELLVCFFLLSTLGSWVILQGASMVKTFRSDQARKTLEEELVFLSHLASSTQVDLSLELSWGKGGLICQRKSEQAGVDMGFVKGRVLRLRGVQKVWIDDEPLVDSRLIVFYASHPFDFAPLRIRIEV